MKTIILIALGLFAGFFIAQHFIADNFTNQEFLFRNNSSKNITTIQITYTSQLCSSSCTVELPAINPGQYDQYSFYNPGQSSYQVTVTFDDGTTVQTQNPSVTGSNRATELITDSGIEERMNALNANFKF